MAFFTQGKTNWKYILVVVILTIVIGTGVPSFGMAVEKEISGPLKEQSLDSISVLFEWLQFLGILVIPIFIFVLLAPYFIIKLGFKILKITGIPRSKIIVFLLAIFLCSLFLSSVISKNFWILNTLLFGIIFLFLKYYFLLPGKKLWQFLLYLVVINLVISLIFFLIILLLNAGGYLLKK